LVHVKVSDINADLDNPDDGLDLPERFPVKRGSQKG
jgi:hypothetical protein